MFLFLIEPVLWGAALYSQEAQQGLTKLQDEDVSTCIDFTTSDTFWKTGATIDIISYKKESIISNSTVKIRLDTDMDLNVIASYTQLLLLHREWFVHGDSCKIGSELCGDYIPCSYEGVTGGSNGLVYQCFCPWGQCIVMNLNVAPFVEMETGFFSICEVQVV